MRKLKSLSNLSVIRGGLLALLLLFGLRPSPRLVTVGPQRQVHTINPKMGAHTRLTDEVEEWKIKRTLEMVREMGAPWIVEFFPWAYYEPEKGVFYWEHPDMVIDHARAQGLTVVARLGLTPAWARMGPASGGPGELRSAPASRLSPRQGGQP